MWNDEQDWVSFTTCGEGAYESYVADGEIPEDALYVEWWSQTVVAMWGIQTYGGLSSLGRSTGIGMSTWDDERAWVSFTTDAEGVHADYAANSEAPEGPLHGE